MDNSHELLLRFVVTDFRYSPCAGGRGGPEPRGEAGPGEEDEEDPEKGREEEA